MTRTNGNIIVEEIKIGDIHYEFEHGFCVKSKVLTLPTKNQEGNWIWTSENVNSGKVMEYMVNPNYPHYSVNLYDFEAYMGMKYV